MLVGGYDAWRAANGPIQVDAGWEQVFRVDDPPSGVGQDARWTRARCRYARDEKAAVPRRRECVHRVPHPLPMLAGSPVLSQRIDARGMRGVPLTLSVMVKSEKLEQRAFLWIAAEDAQGRTMPISPPDAAPVTGTTDWHAIQASGIVPAEAVNVLVGLSLVTSGRSLDGRHPARG